MTKHIARMKGSISLFSAITFFLVLALLFGLLESARTYGLYANAYAKSELGVVSAYSNYAAEVAEVFGILLFWEDGGTMEDMLLSCLDKQTDGEDNLILRLSSASVDLDQKVYLTEEGGIYFLKQVADLVPYRITGEVISDILSLGDLQSQMSVISDFTEMVEKAQDNFTEIGEALEEVKGFVTSIKSLKSVITSTFQSVKTSAESVKDFATTFGDSIQELMDLWAQEDLENAADEEGSGSGDPDADEEAEDEEAENIAEAIAELYAELETAWNGVRTPYETARGNLLQIVKSLQTTVDSALEALEAFESLQETAKEALEEMEELLDSYKDVIPSTMYQELLSQVQNMAETFTITDTDVYGRVNLKSALEKVKELAASLVSKIEACEMPEFEEVTEKIRGKTVDEAKQYLKSLGQMATDNLSEAVDEFTDNIADLTYLEAESTSTASGTKGLTTGILEAITSLASDGIFGLVLGDAGAVSTLTADTGDLPSKTSKSTSSEQKTFLKSGTNRALMAAYCGLYFGSYLDPASDSAIAYEMEYVLAGNASDRTNLSTVMGEIFLIREGINYAYLLTDSVKMEEAGAVALALATAVGLPILKIPIQLLLLAAWAAAESVSDLQRLYGGESVSLVKTSSDWKMSLENLAGLVDGSALTAGTGSTGSAGDDLLSFGYETYLLILLLLQNGQTQTYRMMDVIQMRMQTSVREDFLMKEGVVYTEGTISFCSTALFSDTWVLKQLLSIPSDYTIETSFSYGYVK